MRPWILSAVLTVSLIFPPPAPARCGSGRQGSQGLKVDSQTVATEQQEPACSEAVLSELQKNVEVQNPEVDLGVFRAHATECSGNAEYHAFFSHAFENGGDLANAAREMNTAIKLDPQRPSFFFQLSQILFKNGDLGGARLLLERANRDFSQELWTYLFLATVYRDLGSIKEADQILSNAVRNWPLNPEVHILRGNVLAQTDAPQAVVEFKKALDINPKSPQGYLFYGIELSKLNQIEDAVRALSQCVQLAPEMPNAHYYLGEALLKQGKPVEAIEHLQTAINLDPQYALAYFQLGKAYRQLGDRRRARECMQKYGLLSTQEKSENSERSKRFRDSLAAPEQTK